MTSRRLCFSCDLKNDPELIARYKEYHTPGKAWPEITQSIKDSGITDMQIFLTGNRMFMIMEVNKNFDPDRKAKLDTENSRVQEWEELMWTFQQALPWAKEGEKWVAMEKIFQL